MKWVARILAVGWVLHLGLHVGCGVAVFEALRRGVN